MTLSNETPKDAARRMAKAVILEGFKPQALHEYTDTKGKPLHWRIRLKNPDTGDKWIRPMKVNGEGYMLGEPDYPEGKPLYRLHDLATRPDDVVTVVEGEWCADALIKIGVLATTSGAADSTGKADWRPLAGRTVNIWPDNDEAGRRYGEAVADVMLALGCTVHLIDVQSLSLPPKGDAVDWIEGHANATQADIESLPMVAQLIGMESVGRAIADATAPARDESQPDKKNALAGDGDGWTQPQPLTAKVEPEPYPLDALPDTIQAAVQEVADFVKAPLPMVASSALAALSLAIQAHADAKRAEKLHGPVGLFLLTIADSGERKSTCDGFFTRAIRDYEEAQAEAAKPILKDHKAAIEAWEAKRGGVKENIRQLAKAGKPTCSAEQTLRDLEHDKPEPPRIPRLLYADATPEALAYGLAKQWPSGGVVSAEAGIVFGSHGMGKDSVMRNLGLLNQLWDGASLTIDRRSTESFTVRGARLTVALQVQEPTLREFFTRSGALARGTGFLARFLVAWPESMQGLRPFTEAPANWPHLAAFHRRIADILEQPVPIDDDGALIPPMLSMTTEAKAAWVEYHDAIERELSSGGELYDVRDVASKSADNAARLATLFQLFEHGTGDAVGLPAFEGASRIAAWHLNEARRFFGELALPAELLDAARLDDWLIGYCRRERTHLVPTREAQRFGPVRDKERLSTALRELEEFDRVRVTQEGKRKTVKVNPALVVAS
jgi:putative DNA primase/helicase